MPDLGIHAVLVTNSSGREVWIAGSSPAMTTLYRAAIASLTISRLHPHTAAPQSSASVAIETLGAHE
jgi:hypothetical protein